MSENHSSRSLIGKLVSHLEKARQNVVEVVPKSNSIIKDFFASRCETDSTHIISLPETYKRIYHFHVRKTGGTSLNEAFWNLAGLELEDFGRRKCVANNRFVFVRHSKRKIEHGNYFFANSHLPSHQLSLPPDTYSVTVFRDPGKRVLSLYKYFRWIHDDEKARFHEPYWKTLRIEAQIIGSSFHEFLTNLPRRDLLNQLYMFSKSFNIDDALENVHKCSSVLFLENFKNDLARLSERLGLCLVERHARRFGRNDVFELSKSESIRLEELVEPERQFISQIRSL